MSAPPRIYGSCTHCDGRLEKSMDHPPHCPRCGRKQAPLGPRYSERVLEEFVRAACRAGSAHQETEALLARCTHRLEIGAVEYGDLQFYNADCAKEAGEEGVDAINWSFLDYTKSLAGQGGPDPDDDARDLAHIAAYGAAIYAASERIRARRRGSDTS